jgi:hypothetical protein
MALPFYLECRDRNPVIWIDHSPLPRLRPPLLSPDPEEVPEGPPLLEPGPEYPPGLEPAPEDPLAEGDMPNALAVCASTVPVAGSPFAC